MALSEQKKDMQTVRHSDVGLVREMEPEMELLMVQEMELETELKMETWTAPKTELLMALQTEPGKGVAMEP
jgi:hypothetical protein